MTSLPHRSNRKQQELILFHNYSSPKPMRGDFRVYCAATSPQLVGSPTPTHPLSSAGSTGVGLRGDPDLMDVVVGFT